jgi:retron-type reverse transcriptase
MVHRKFHKGTMLNATICELSSLLGMGIRYSRRNFWVYVYTQTNYPYCSRKVIGEVRKNKFSSGSKMNNEPTDLIHNKEKRQHKFSNNNELFYKASSVEALIEAWIQLKSNPGMLTSGSETLHKISKQWFEKISEKLRRGDMKYPSVRRIEIPKPTGKSGTRPLTRSNPRIKVIERAFLNFLEPQFEGIFNWEPVTKEECQRLEKEGSTNIKTLYEKDSSKTVYLKMNWVSPKIFKDSSVGFRPNRSVHMALHKIKHWRTNTVYFIDCDIKKAFETIHRGKLKNAFKAVIVDEKFWLEIQKMLNAGYLKENLVYCDELGVFQDSILSPFLFNIYMHDLDVFIDRLNKTNIEKYKDTKNSQYGDQEARKAYKRIQYKYGEGIYHTLRKLGSKEEFMKQRKIDYAEHYKKYKIWSGIDKDNRFISYVRYADDFLIGIIGSRKYALQVRQDVTNFIKSNLHLDVSRSELVNRNEGKVTFLGHSIKLVSLIMKTRVQHSSISAAKKAKNRVLSRIKVNEKRLTRALFYRTQKKTIELLNGVSQSLGLKPTSKKNIEASAFTAIIKYLKEIRDKIFTTTPHNTKRTFNPAMDRLHKGNDERIQLDEQSACYSLIEAVKGVRIQIENDEPENTSREIIKVLKDFEKNVKEIEENAVANLIDEKRQSLIKQHVRREKKKLSSRISSEIEEEIKEILELAPELVKAELAATKTVNIRISADLKKIVGKLRIKGYFHSLKERPSSNPYLVNLSDAEIIKNYNNIMHGLLNWFSSADNFYAVKGVIEALRKSCALTLKLKHRYRSLHKVYTIYGLDIKTSEAELYPRLKVLNRKKGFNLGEGLNKMDHSDLWYLIEKVKFRSHGVSFFLSCSVKGCNNTDIEIHHMGRLKRTIKKNGIRADVDKKGHTVTGIHAILTSIKRKQLPLCKPHHLEFESGKFSDLDHIKLNEVLNRNKGAFSFPSDFKSVFEGKPYEIVIF